MRASHGALVHVSPTCDEDRDTRCSSSAFWACFALMESTACKPLSV